MDCNWSTGTVFSTGVRWPATIGGKSSSPSNFPAAGIKSWASFMAVSAATSDWLWIAVLPSLSNPWAINRSAAMNSARAAKMAPRPASSKPWRICWSDCIAIFSIASERICGGGGSRPGDAGIVGGESVGKGAGAGKGAGSRETASCGGVFCAGGRGCAAGANSSGPAGIEGGTLISAASCKTGGVTVSPADAGDTAPAESGGNSGRYLGHSGLTRSHEGESVSVAERGRAARRCPCSMGR